MVNEEEYTTFATHWHTPKDIAPLNACRATYGPSPRRSGLRSREGGATCPPMPEWW